VVLSFQLLINNPEVSSTLDFRERIAKILERDFSSLDFRENCEDSRERLWKISSSSNSREGTRGCADELFLEIKVSLEGKGGVLSQISIFREKRALIPTFKVRVRIFFLFLA